MSHNVGNEFEERRDFFEAEHLKESLKHVARTLGISNPRYIARSGSKKGDNYISRIYRVFIEGEKNNSPIKIQTIFKLPPKIESSRRAMDVDYLFPREHYVYKEIVPIFKQLLKSRDMELLNIAECYFSSVVDHEEVFVFEDLQPLGFVMRDRIGLMDFAHTSLTFRALGRFHALSFALRDQKPEIFKDKIATLKEVAFRSDYTASASVIGCYEVLGNMVKTALVEDDPKYTERFSHFLESIFTHAERACDGSIAEPYAVLCHGDFWMNNMMFKYEKESGEPRDIYMLDFQFARYASPAVDISFALFSSCGQELREKHFDELIKIYHESLSAYLVELGSDPEKLFPFEALLDQMHNFSIAGAAMALMAIPLLVSQGDDIPNVLFDEDDLNRLGERILRDDFLKKTLRETFKDLMDRNYI